MTTLTAEPRPALAPAAPNFIHLADDALARGDTAAVCRHLGAAALADPDNPGLRLALGNAKLHQRDLSGALAEYEHAAGLVPRSAEARASMALALQLLGRPHEAEAAATVALVLDPKQRIALKVMARVHLDAGRPDAARACCERVLAHDSADADALQLRAQCQAPSLNVRAALPGNPFAAAARSAPTASPAASPLEGLLGDFAERTKSWQRLGPEHLLQQFVVGLEPRRAVVRPKPAPLPKGPDGFPVPPVELTMGYGAGDLDYYLKIGRRSREALDAILAAQGVTLEKGDAMLDWGCAAGRVTRCFAEEARRGVAVWGGDVHAPSIAWATAHLAPPFRFFNGSALPHLPFADGAFKFIYGLSVMTHLVALRDLWLLELHRVLRPGGCAVLTIHDEHTWAWFCEKGMPGWMPEELRGEPALPGEVVDVQGSTWDQTYTFFHSDYVRRVWGQCFRVADIIPRADSYQAAVVLRKD
jgi:SAM-dependent methyltransferase/Tfp pilus assembly protein PilF